MFSPEAVPTLVDEDQPLSPAEITSEAPLLAEALISTSYLESWLQVRYLSPVEIQVQETGPAQFQVRVNRHHQREINPLMIQSEIEHQLKQEGYSLADAETIFPDDENDLNYFQLNLTFRPAA